jgi:hypothetical protein
MAMLDVLRYNIDMSDNISGVESGAARDGNPRRLLCDDGMLSAADQRLMKVSTVFTGFEEWL